MAHISALLGVKDVSIEKFLPAHLQPPPPEPETPEERSMRIKATFAAVREARAQRQAEAKARKTT